MHETIWNFNSEKTFDDFQRILLTIGDCDKRHNICLYTYLWEIHTEIFMDEIISMICISKSLKIVLHAFAYYYKAYKVAEVVCVYDFIMK